MHTRNKLALSVWARSCTAARYRGLIKTLFSVSVLIVLFSPGSAQALTDSLSFTGGLASATSDFEQSFTIPATEQVTIQTFGFGGGTNAAGVVIPAGGFDSTVSLFSGSGPSASIVLLGGNPAASSDLLSLFSPGCPPAGMVTIGTGVGASVCGDNQLVVPNLSAGTYTLVLTDAGYWPVAVNPGPPTHSLLSDGFGSLGTPSFQTCNTTSDGTTCVTGTSNFAVDIVANGVVPEPGTFALVAAGLAMVAARRQRALHRSRT
jgi:hypothetical protein